MLYKQKKVVNKEETQQVAYEFAQTLVPGDVLCFYGDLGAGKTTFIQGLAKGLEITRRIVSPTFIIMRSYPVNREGINVFYHADLYRLNAESEVPGTGLLESLQEKNALVAIEWPDRMGTKLPTKRYDIHMIPLDGDNREILIEKK